MTKKLFEINPSLDLSGYITDFAHHTRTQIRNVLTEETAKEIRQILAGQTPWGLAMQAGDSAGQKPQQILAHELLTQQGKRAAQELVNKAAGATAQGGFGFHFAQYSLVQAYLEKWNEGGPHDMLLEYLNTPEFLDLVRTVTGISELKKADGQATLYAPQHFLGLHMDSHVEEGWRVAYILNLGLDEWKPDWGGYLNFFDDSGDVIRGYRPRFNALNLFLVPQPHNVSYVPPFSPVGRFAITGWFSDR